MAGSGWSAGSTLGEKLGRVDQYPQEILDGFGPVGHVPEMFQAAGEFAGGGLTSEDGEIELSEQGAGLLDGQQPLGEPARVELFLQGRVCLLYTSPSPRDRG